MNNSQLKRCIQVIKALRDPKSGCPWDLEQTHKSLLKYLIEESYEFLEAVEKEDHESMEEELGDILLQVLLHSTIAEEKKYFNLESVAEKLADKIIRRHPHVFDKNISQLSIDEVIKNWEKIKKEEKNKKEYSITEKYLHSPSLESAYRIGKKSTELNFDWDNHHQVLEKVEEELQEVKSELVFGNTVNKSRVKEEIGDLLFSVAQLARHLDINPEECLREANKKFISRFRGIEDILVSSGKNIKEISRERMEELWIEVKKNAKN